MKLTIPGKPPSENHMWHRARNRYGATINIYKSDARVWFDQTKILARMEAKKNKWTLPDAGKWVVVRLKFYFPTKNHPDPSNCLKAFLDALEGELYLNDKWVLPQIIGVDFDKTNPRTEVEVEEIA